MDGFHGCNQDKSFPLDRDGRLKQSHPYYSQVQGQMLVIERRFCNFVVWCKNDMKIDRVFKNAQFCSKLLKLKQVFNERMLPEIITRSHMPDYDNQNKQYCYCKHPSFEPMIGCDGKNCKIQWFHFVCVGIRRQPKSNWLCKECQNRNLQLEKAL